MIEGVVNKNSSTTNLSGNQIAILLNYHYQRFLQEIDVIEKKQKIITNAFRRMDDQIKEASVRKFIDKL